MKFSNIAEILVVAYLIYYLGNVLYDLFLKKEAVITKDIDEDANIDISGIAEEFKQQTIEVESQQDLKQTTDLSNEEEDAKKKNIESKTSLEIEHRGGYYVGELKQMFQEQEDNSDNPFTSIMQRHNK